MPEEKKLKNIIKKIGVKKGHHFYVADLLPVGNPTKIGDQIFKEIGPHEIIVHSVGGALGVSNPFANYDDWKKVWRFNVGIAIEINNIFVKPLIKRKWGRVIHVSSISAKDGDAKITLCIL